MDEHAASTEPSGAAPGRRTGDVALPERGHALRAPSMSRYHPVWWALAFGAVTTAGLGILAWWILIAHALSHGVADVISPGAMAAPDGRRYGLALAGGGIVNLSSAMALAWLAFHTPGRTWPPAAQGLAAALVAAVGAACALLLTLGINPVDLVVAL
ncbi:MAG TPA: hypothetical protein VFT81_03345 [Dermatophilaceae bacterium]|nr:hypothetical protein [Dermatophilaceae bacterium]